MFDQQTPAEIAACYDSCMRALVTGGTGRVAGDRAPARGRRLDGFAAGRADGDLAARRGASARRAGVEELGGLDLLVNAAGEGFAPSRSSEVDEADWDAALGATAKGRFFSRRPRRRHLRESGGCVVMVEDVAAYQPWPSFAPHCAAKAAQAMLTRVFARALAPEVRVCGVAPGPVAVEPGQEERRAAETLLGRIGSPDDVADAVVYLAGASFVTGSTLFVDGGRSLNPARLRRRRKQCDGARARQPALAREVGTRHHAGRGRQRPQRRRADPPNRRGDRGAFEVLYRRYARPVFGLALRRLGDRGRAEDAVQETFASIWRVGPSYRPERGPGAPWLYAVARNAIIDRGRARTEPPAEAPDDAPRPDAGPAERAEAGWTAWRVHRALEELNANERKVIELAYWSGLSQREIAEYLGIPLGTVKTRTRAALADWPTCSKRSSVTDRPDFRELVGGDDLSTDEAARLQRVHDLLIEAGPPPELPPHLLEEPDPEGGAATTSRACRAAAGRCSASRRRSR